MKRLEVRSGLGRSRGRADWMMMWGRGLRNGMVVVMETMD